MSGRSLVATAVTDSASSHANISSSAEKSKSSTHLLVQATLHPKTSYFHPLAHTSSDSDVDLQIEHLFSIESLGIREANESVSTQERKLVDRFTEEVEFKDGKYFVRYHSTTTSPKSQKTMT